MAVAVLRTPFTALLGIEHPVVCGGMGGGATDGELAGRVSEAGGLGVIGASFVPPKNVEKMVERAEAGANVIVAQGNEGRGHVGELGTTVVVRQVVKAVAPIPVLAAGGLADGAGLAAALALGADGVLLGTRFLATEEAPVDAAYKRAVLASEGDDTIVTTVSDTLSGRDWPAPGRACDEHASSRNGWAGSPSSADGGQRCGRDSRQPKSPTPTTGSCGSGSQPA